IGDLDAARHSVLETGEETRHFLGWFEMAFRIDGEAKAGFGEAAFLVDASEDVGELTALRHVVVHVVHRDERRAEIIAEFGKEAKSARLVAAMAMHAGEENAPRGCV